jgi:hypothetical protein
MHNIPEDLNLEIILILYYLLIFVEEKSINQYYNNITVHKCFQYSNSSVFLLEVLPLVKML